MSEFYNAEYLSERLAAVCKERDELRQIVEKQVRMNRVTAQTALELDTLHGENAVLKKRIEEALLADDRITAVTDFSFQQEKGSVTASFLVHTIFGEMRAERTVDI